MLSKADLLNSIEVYASNLPEAERRAFAKEAASAALGKPVKTLSENHRYSIPVRLLCHYELPSGRIKFALIVRNNPKSPGKLALPAKHPADSDAAGNFVPTDPLVWAQKTAETELKLSIAADKFEAVPQPTVEEDYLGERRAVAADYFAVKLTREQYRQLRKTTSEAAQAVRFLTAAEALAAEAEGKISAPGYTAAMTYMEKIIRSRMD